MKRWEIVIKKKVSNFFYKIEVIRLENEVVIFKIVFGMVHGQPYKGFQKIPLIPILITCHWNIFSSRIKTILLLSNIIDHSHIKEPF